MIYDKLLKKLARTGRWQHLYALSKEINGIRLFPHKEELSRIQLTFIALLERYHNLYTDIALGEQYIDNNRIKDDIFVDAYLYYKQYHRQNRTQEKEQKKKNNTKIPTVLFKKRR